MKNEKEKEKEEHPIDKAVQAVSKMFSNVRRRINASKTTKTKDRRLPTPTDALTPPEKLMVENPRILVSRK